MKIGYHFIFFILQLLMSLTAIAQGNKKVSGLVTDTSKLGISEARLMLITAKDTLHATTDKEGYFSFAKVKVEQFTLVVTSLGYQDFSANYNFGQQKTLTIPEIILKISGQMLKEIVVRGKPNPIRIMQDTIEYNAAAYQVFDGDNVADLLKQFPGIEVDGDYNVKTMGKEMTKLRVNGKDFFTNDVRDFISKLPAQIVATIQIIDDYGDDANFTGIKIGEPQKMLNIVTKPGMNRGKFGSASVNGGTNDQIGVQANVNLWNDSKQSGGNIRYGTQNNGAGEAQNVSAGASYRDKIGKKGNLGINVNFANNGTAFKNEQASETISTLGTFYNQSQNNGENKSNNASLNWNYSFNNKKINLSTNANIALSNASTVSSSFNAQSGIIRQDLKNLRTSANKSPRLNASVSLSKILGNKNNFSANFGLSSSDNQSVQTINTNTLYYDKTTNVLVKDSLLSRQLDNSGNSQNFNIGFNYSLNLKKPKDSLAYRSLNFAYSGSVGLSSNSLSTLVFNNLNRQPVYVDSLSSNARSTSINQSLGLNYNYSNKKMRLNLGFNARPSLLSSNYINLALKVKNNSLNYSPNISYNRMMSKSKNLSIRYSGNNNNPSLYQLQPVKNTQNLQNIVVGNPNLKASFNHNLSSNFNYVHTKSGRSLMAGLSFSTTQNEIVNNVIFIPDTLNSVKQETHFENTNGTFNLNSSYNLNIPIKKNKYSIAYSGNFGFSNKAIFINNDKKMNTGFNFSQNINSTVILKKLSLNGSLGYSLSTNNNYLLQNDFDNGAFNLGQFSGATFFRTATYRGEIGSMLRLKKVNFMGNINYNRSINKNSAILANFREISSVSFSLSGNATLLKTYRIGFNGSKVMNTGYSLANNNPFLLNASLSKVFLKDRSLSMNINANDLLGQGNNISRSIVGNSVVDRKMSQVTRVVTIGLNYSLSKFGAAGRTYRVDADELY